MNCDYLEIYLEKCGCLTKENKEYYEKHGELRYVKEICGSNVVIYRKGKWLIEEDKIKRLLGL